MTGLIDKARDYYGQLELTEVEYADDEEDEEADESADEQKPAPESQPDGVQPAQPQDEDPPFWRVAAMWHWLRDSDFSH